MAIWWMLSLFLLNGIARSTSDFVSTQPSLTAVRGEKVTLPCQFKGIPTGVYWYQRNATGAPDSQAEIVVQYYLGDHISRRGAKFSISDDYSMVIADVSVQDETTYRCSVALKDNTVGKNYTDVRVIALANPPHPTVTDCKIVGLTRCEYTLAKVVPESFPLTCRVSRVRPTLNLTWTGTDGEIRAAGVTFQTKPDQDGLFNVSLVFQVSKTEIGREFVCLGSGESLKGRAEMTVAVKKPAETKGLSAGAVFGIVFAVIVLIVTVAIILIYVHRVRNRSISKTEQVIPLLKFEAETRELTEDIKNYKPGSISCLERQREQKLPPVVRLGVFGVTHAGKSSLVRSFRYAVQGDFNIGVEIAQSLSSGGVTIDTKSYSITDAICVVDNRGLRDMDVKHIPGIMELIRGKSNKLEQGACIDCPILVFDARQPTSALESFLPAFVNAIRGEFGTHPAVVFTHRDAEKGQLEVLRVKATGFGALDQRLFFIENFTEEPNEAYSEQRLDILKMLKKMLDTADENLVHRTNRRDRGNGDSEIDVGYEKSSVSPVNRSRWTGLLKLFRRT